MVDDRAPRCHVVVAGDSYRARQGTEFSTGISAQSVGAAGICLHLSVIPPGARAKAHLHAGHETAIYVIEGAVDTWYGESLEECVTARTGEFIYIPAGMPHLPVNRSQTQPLTVVLARTDPNEQESVVLLPELDERLGPSGSLPS